jgi:BatD DUF11 like domain
MKKTFFFSVFLLSVATLFSTKLLAQEAKFTVEVNRNEVAVGKRFKVIFTLENANGSNFELPKMDNFEVVSGPNVSSSFSMMNGETTQSMRYTYYMVAQTIGSFPIPSATIKVGKEKLRTEPIVIKVLEKNNKEKSDEDSDENGGETPSFGPFKGMHDPFELLRKRQSPPQKEDDTPVEQPKKARKTYKT